jgi:hypothetical protein
LSEEELDKLELKKVKARGWDVDSKKLGELVESIEDLTTKKNEFRDSQRKNKKTGKRKLLLV